MNYEAPTLTAEWMPTVWPGCDANGGVTPIYMSLMLGTDWEPFPGDIESFSMNRGRQSTTDEFKGGGAHVVFANEAGTLDPLAPGSVTADTYGCLFRIIAEWNGTESVLFCGLIDSPWVPSWGRGRRRTVEVDLCDWYARAAIEDQPGAPANLVNHTWGGSPPHTQFVWWRGAMSATAAAAANNARIWDYARGGNHGRITSGLVTAVDPIDGCDLQSLQLAVNTTIESTDVIPATDYVTASVALTLPTAGTYGGEQVLFSFVSTTGARRWSVGVDSGGHLVWRVYNASGVSVATRSSTGLYGGQSMICAISIDWVAGVLYPWAGASVSFTGAASSSGRLVLSGTTSGTAVVVAGNAAYAGGTSALQPLDVRPVKDTATVRIPKGTGVPFAPGTSQPIAIDMPPVVERPIDAANASTAVAVFGPGQACLAAVATGIGGVVWCRRDGWIVIRTADDLGWWPASRGPSDAVDDDLYEVVARITDDPAPTPLVGAVSGATYDLPILRYAGPGHHGPDPDRVINTVVVGAALIVDPASIRRYGSRPLSMTPTVSSTPGYIAPAASDDGHRLNGPRQYPVPVVPDDPIAVQAQAIVDARKAPSIATPQVVLSPYGDTAITEFVIADLELETRVLLTQSDQVTAAPVIEDMRVRVQGETWDWSAGGTQWTVTLDFAVPVPNK